MDSGRREAISGGVGATYLEDDRGAFLEWEIPVGTVEMSLHREGDVGI